MYILLEVGENIIWSVENNKHNLDSKLLGWKQI